MNEEPPGSGRRDPEPELPEEAGAHPPQPGEPPGFPPSPDPEPPDPTTPLGPGDQPGGYGQPFSYGPYSVYSQPGGYGQPTDPGQPAGYGRQGAHDQPPEYQPSSQGGSGHGPQAAYGQPLGGQPPAYGQPGWYGYYPAQPQTEGTAIGALVAALLGIPLFFCAPVGAIVALVLASTAKKRIDASGGALTGLGLVTAARIIAIVELALIALGLLVTALLIASSVTTSPGSFSGSVG